MYDKLHKASQRYEDCVNLALLVIKSSLLNFFRYTSFSVETMFLYPLGLVQFKQLTAYHI